MVDHEHDWQPHANGRVFVNIKDQTDAVTYEQCTRCPEVRPVRVVPSTPMDFHDWLRIGIENGFCSEGFCNTHDGLPLTPEEEQEFEDGHDPCIPAVRVW